MKKLLAYIINFILLIALCLTACTSAANTETSDEDPVVQTLVALSLTQTAMAEQQEIIQTDAEATEPPVDEPSTEEVAETQAPQETAEPTEISHTLIPGEPGWISKWFYDTDTSKTASGAYVNGGDDFVANLWERPFTDTEMVYRSDIDIIKTEISQDSNFHYVTIYLHDTHPDGGLPASYGVEMDTDKDGRGDLLIIVQNPTSATWDIAGVSVYKDTNNDIGGMTIMRPDTNYNGDGYDQVVFSNIVLDDPDAAWARVDTNTPSVSFAYKKTLLEGATTFVWGVWSAESLLDPAMLDLHDHFTQNEAGSPYKSHSTYPLKGINLVDNTCRETYGFEATVPIPGLCSVPEPPTPVPPTPTPIPPTAEPTTPVEIETGSIYGVAFDDSNNNGVRDTGEPLSIYNVTVSLHPNACSNPSIRSASGTNLSFGFGTLTSGTYCVQITGGGSMTTPSSYTFDLSPGGSQYVEFGFYVVQ